MKINELVVLLSIQVNFTKIMSSKKNLQKITENETISMLLSDMCHSWEFRGFQPLNSNEELQWNHTVLSHEFS